MSGTVGAPIGKPVVIPSQLFQPNPDGSPNVTGPYSIDGLTNRKTAALEWSATVEGWPTDPSIVLFRLKCQWDNGDFAEWPVNCGRTDRDGIPATTVGSRIYVPRDGKQVASGAMTLTVLYPFQSSFTFTALSA